MSESQNINFKALHQQALDDLARVVDAAALDAWRVLYLGKKSGLTLLLRSLSGLAPEERRVVGAMANQLKTVLEAMLSEKKQALEEASLAAAATRASIDVSLPGDPVALGRVHIITRVNREICDIFLNMGFAIAEGPDVETDYYNFEALNIPADHPARDSFSTFWLDSKTGGSPLLLRTHTSPVQIRVMEQKQPPIRTISPGRVYRYEATDATHESMFHQVEGFAVDRGITLADLKGTLTQFTRRLFGAGRRLRFRVDFFPFVEPGVEGAINCLACNGAGCRLCGNSGWLEILGAGMVHPEVLRGCGIDPDVYTGFAFGMGVDRIAMLKYGVDDIRLFYNNDIRFLSQFP